MSMTNFGGTFISNTLPAGPGFEMICVIANAKPGFCDCRSLEMTGYYSRNRAIAVGESFHPCWASMNRAIVSGYQRYVGNF